MEMRPPIQGLFDLIEISDQDRLLLKSRADQTEAWADEFVNMFYDTLFAYPHTRALFRDGERPHREKTLKDWYLQIVRGEFNDQFWHDQMRISDRHIERQILNSYMLGMMHRTQRFFFAKCLATFPQEDAKKIFSAFKAVTDIVAGIIAEGYHNPYAVRKVPTYHIEAK